MPDNGHVSQDQCEERRNHLGIALVKTVDSIRADQKEFWSEVKADLKGAAATLQNTAERVVRVEERSKSNRTWIVWLIRGVFGAVLVAVIVAAILHFGSG